MLTACNLHLLTRMAPYNYPQAPPDLIRTVAYGTLLFDSSSSEEELGLQVPYRNITESFREAVQYVKEYDNQRALGKS